MRPEDLGPVLEIESASFSHPWIRRHFLDEIESPFGFPTVATLPDGTIAGYLCLKQIIDEAEILDVAVDPSQRGKGVGRLLLQNALAASRAKGAVVVALEVRTGNDEAIALYRRAGFREVGRRRKYYNDGEDAILMDYSLSKDEECDAV